MDLSGVNTSDISSQKRCRYSCRIDQRGADIFAFFSAKYTIMNLDLIIDITSKLTFSTKVSDAFS